MANLNIKLVKSLNGRLEKHIATANNAQTKGKIAKIGYLLQVTEVE